MLRIPFAAAVLSTTADAEPPGIDVAAVDAQFSALMEATKNAQSEDHLRVLVEEAKTLSRLRAFVYSQPRISQMYVVGLNTMKGWGIPSDDFAELCDATKVCRDGEVGPARNGLHTVLTECDTWSDYVDEMVTIHRRLASALLLLAGVTGFFSINRLVFGDVLYGFLLGGITGAILSVTSRLPSIPRYETFVAGILSIFGRIGAGFVATVLGGSLIAMNVVSINLPGDKTTLAEIFERCGTGSLPIGSRAPKFLIVDAPRLDSGRLSDSPSGRCETGHVLLLLGLSLLLGFSERALPSFERKILPENITGTSPERRRIGKETT